MKFHRNNDVASFFSLLQPALENGIGISSFGLLARSLMYGFDIFVPHEHPLKAVEEDEKAGRLRKILIIIAAVTLHNLLGGLLSRSCVWMVISRLRGI